MNTLPTSFVRASSLLEAHVDSGDLVTLENSRDLIDWLSSLCCEYGIAFTDEKLLLVTRHLVEMLRKTQIVNLTSIRKPADALVLHLFDSLLFVKVIQDLYENPSLEGYKPQDAHILDMGTGGGFPGIPLACILSSDVTLLDSVGKKISACREFVNDLGINRSAHPVHARLEDYALSHLRSFEFVSARALASLDILIEYAEPFVVWNGYLVLGKGTPDKVEIFDARLVSASCGFDLVSRETFELPYGYGHREFYIYEKLFSPEFRLPRANGLARRERLVDLLK